MEMKRMGKRGFTLIELMLVMAIVLILASLIIPTVQVGIQRAQQTACKSALSNVFDATLMFTTDNDQYLPGNQEGPSTEYGLWRGQHMILTKTAPHSLTTYIRDYLAPNVTKNGFRLDNTFCPANRKRSTHFYSMTYILNYWMKDNTNDRMLVWGRPDLDSGAVGIRSLRIGEVESANPEEKWAIGDVDQVIPYTDPNWYWYPWMPTRRVHPDWNQIYFDGHVEVLR